jgi:glycosyltransferase involved in cell wall biosynthesis
LGAACHENEDLAQLIRRNGCEREVELLGLRSDVGELARALDLHLSSSSAEAFPNVVAETMLSGTPNVVTDVGDSAFIVGKTGWVVPAQDPERMAEGISGRTANGPNAMTVGNSGASKPGAGSSNGSPSHDPCLRGGLETGDRDPLKFFS